MLLFDEPFALVKEIQKLALAGCELMRPEEFRFCCYCQFLFGVSL
jgi:hypothetical protein